MKKAFTLIELLVSISLLMLMVLFLYESYDVTLASNEQFEKNVDKRVTFNQSRKIIMEDFLEGTVLELTNSGNNSVVLLKTNNTHHNAFYNYVTYFISKENNLLRVESYAPFNTQKLDASFFDKAFIDIIQNNMTQFKLNALKQNNSAYSVILQRDSGESDVFTVLQILES